MKAAEFDARKGRGEAVAEMTCANQNSLSDRYPLDLSSGR